jgi:SAM-dependent methyltransferase
LAASREAGVATNELERGRWNDERWVTVWPKRERMTDAVTAYVLDAAALAPGERVLDVGCGGGNTSLAAARVVGAEGAVVGADISTQLTALAQRRAAEAGVTNVEFNAVDMQVDKVAGGPFDVAISQFGVMFFEEPQTAFANIRAHLHAGSRLAFACWQPVECNAWFFGRAIMNFVPPPPPPAPGKSPTGPFSLADPDQTAELLRAAGFEGIQRTAHELDVDVPRDAVVDVAQLAFLGVSAENLPAAETAVNDYMEQFAVGGEQLRLPLAFQVFQAVNPSEVSTG